MEYKTDAQVEREAKSKNAKNLKSNKPKPQPRTDVDLKNAATSAAMSAKSSQQAADSAAIAADSVSDTVGLMSQSQQGLIEALQETINNNSKREPVRLKVNRVWDKTAKANLIDSIDILPLTAKA